ncbi:MAG: hypothetical protein A2Y66_00945 [Nitrospirae bacterium RBG_13_41_22]|nr:MAG: hypothetical protein A2Y66_00945 [Nitrospirae bacterium RBG_13_41_22]
MKIDLARKSFNAINVLLTRRLLIECDRIPYEFHHLPMKKILNWILVETSILLKPEKPWGWPTHLQVEPSTLCNLRCAFCPVTTGLNRPTGHMTFDIFKKAIDEIGDYLFLILLWDWGEPFLNPEIYEMIAYAKQRDIKIVSSTNGHVFAKGDHAKRLVRSGIDAIIFAIDGIGQETYEQYRAGGDIKTALAGIGKVVAAKHDLNSPTPFINFRFLAMKHNEHEVPRLEAFTKSLGVDALTLKTLNPYDQGECANIKADGLKFIPQTSHYQRFKYNERDGSRIRLKRNPCKRLWNNPVLHWDGKISPCTFDPHGHYVLDDLTRQSFKEIWRGIPFAQFRHQFRKDYQKMSLCADCTNAFKGGSLGDSIAEACFFNPSEKGREIPSKSLLLR